MWEEPIPSNRFEDCPPNLWHTMADHKIEQLYDAIQSGKAKVPYDEMGWENLIDLHNRLGSVARQRQIKAAVVAKLKVTDFVTHIDLYNLPAIIPTILDWWRNS